MQSFQQDEVMRGFPVPRHARVTPETIYSDARYTRWFMQHVREVIPTASIGRAGDNTSPLIRVSTRGLEDWRLDEGRGPSISDVLRQTGTDAFLVMHRGTVLYEKYYGGMGPDTPHMWQSVTKSLVSCVAAALVDRGVIDCAEAVTKYAPELESSAYGGARIEHLLDMQVGIVYSEDYLDPESEASELDRLSGLRAARTPSHPGSTYEFATRMRGQGRHGEGFHYVSLNTNVLGWVMERATGESLPTLIQQEVWGKLGCEHEAYIALDGAGSAQAEGGFCSSLTDMARFGQALCLGGECRNAQVVPGHWIDEVMQGGDREAFAREHGEGMLRGGSYKNCFWVCGDAEATAFMGLGIYGQTLYVCPDADLVIAKFSTQGVADDALAGKLELELCLELSRALLVESI